MDYYLLNEDDRDPRRIKSEREKARKLKKTHWWQRQLQRSLCEYCQGKFPPSELTMDHRVPLARGGKSTASNVVPACKECNSRKKLDTPADDIFKTLGT